MRGGAPRRGPLSALAGLLTYPLYRWQVIVGTTIVVGSVAAGRGREFRLRVSFFYYRDVALLLLVSFGLVLGVDLVGAGLLRLARYWPDPGSSFTRREQEARAIGPQGRTPRAPTSNRR